MQSNTRYSVVEEVSPQKAEQDIKYVLTRGAQKFASDLRKSKYHQLRKYYNEIVSVLDDLKKKDTEYSSSSAEDQRIKIYMLKARASYDCQRRLLDESLVSFIEKWVDYVKNSPDLERFKLVYEAILAYSKQK